MKDFVEKEVFIASETLRDRFAMAAMTGLLASGVNYVGYHTPEDKAKRAYECADAMMKSRDGK